MRLLHYFDHNATAPMSPVARQVWMDAALELPGNPSSLHRIGSRADKALEDARQELASILGCTPLDVVWTSSASESNNAIWYHLSQTLDPEKTAWVSAIEHPCCLDAARHWLGDRCRWIPVTTTGEVDVSWMEANFETQQPGVVCVMAANNETGTLQPVAEIGRLCRDHGVLFHTDAVQWFGKEPVEHIHQFEADLVTVCGHKCHGPKGAGALFIRSPLLPEKILFGGAHENERRAGTENVAGIAGLVQALEMHARTPVFRASPVEQATLTCRRILESLEGVTLLSPESGSLVNTLTFTVENADSIGLLAALDLEGICASSGSACSVGSLEPSHVALAMGASREEANAMVRFSFGRENDLEHVAFMAERLPDILSRCQRTHKSANSL